MSSQQDPAIELILMTKEEFIVLTGLEKDDMNRIFRSYHRGYI